MIPQFCKACGGRLEEMDREFCKAKECQAFARRDVVMRARSDEGTFPSTISKDALLAALQEDINRQVPRERADALRLLRDEVRKHPWDDVSKFDKTRRRLLEAFKTNPNRWQMPEETRIGVDLAKHLGDEVLKRFKNDLTRLALSEPVEGVRLRVDRNVFRSYTDDATGATDVHITATADVPVLFHPMLRDIVVAPCDGDAELFSVPRGRTYADRVEADYNEIADAIKEGRVKKRHVHLAQGAGLDGCAMHFGLYRHQNIWDVQSKVTIPMEPDVNFRKRILAVMPLERGDEVRTWDSGLAGVSIDRMTGAVSDNPSRGRIAGKFDASHGFHLDTVAEMNGIKRKGGETDEMLRSRLYQATEE